jgi:hypothetical protein
MVFFLGEKMIVTGSGEGKASGAAELPNLNVQINAAGIGLLAFRGRRGALDGRRDFGGIRTCECLNNWQHVWDTMVNVT